MKLYTNDKWDKDFRHDGLLYFAQKLQESLFHYTSHIHQYSLFNSQLLVKEYIETLALVENGTLPRSYLDSILEEFLDLYSKDCIIKEKVPHDKSEEILTKLNSSSDFEKDQMMKYLHYYLRNYNDWCKSYLRKIIKNEKEKKKIDFAAKSIISGLIGAGYSKEFINYYNKQVFFSDPVRSIESLDIFLDRFDFQLRTYTVYIAIEKEALAFKDILKNRLSIVFCRNSEVVDFKFDRKMFVVISKTVKAYDEQSAAKATYSSIELFYEFFQFLCDYKGEWISNKCMVLDDNSRKAFVDIKQEGIKVRNPKRRDGIGQISDYLITHLLDQESSAVESIYKAMEIHNVAISEKDISNSFLGLWSIFEILFVNDKREAKIKEITNCVIPIMQSNYLQTQFNNLLFDIESVVPHKELSKLEKTIGSSWNWFVRLVLLDEYEDLRKEMYKLLSNYPLLRSRMCQMNSLYSKKSGMLNDIERYTNRISWHITRLYRTRNCIIHDGKTPEYIRELCEHLHSYIDLCLNRITVLLSIKDMDTIDNAVLDIKLNNELMLKHLKSSERVTENDIVFLFDNLHKDT